MSDSQRERSPVVRQRFTLAERAEAVRIVRSSKGRTIREIAAQLGINDKTLNQWVVAARNAEIDPEGSMSDAAKRRIRELEKEVARLEKDLEFEKKARAFAQQISLRRRSST
ncbi:transposase [Microbacterium sp. NPDC058342]|uniref:transposase n=1 Tax=Microbacterium sp. NPDC058342 TaxID=3346454 RepID=UPI00365B355B